jgi:hypothetical protein
MIKKQTILRIVYVLMAIVAIASVIAYFILLRDRGEWMAFYVACCGGVLIVNLFFVVIFVRKNFKK